MQKYNFVPPPPPPPPPNNKPKVQVIEKVIIARMNHIGKLIIEVEHILGEYPTDELMEKLNLAKELLEKAKEAKSPAEANKLLNEAKNILDDILNQLK